MAGDVWQQVRDAVDIVDVIAEHVALRPAGKEYKGLCPFHDDHRPSMAVVPQKQIFHCFVCGTGGDVFRFTQNFHKMTPGESLRYLAQKAGIKLPDLRGGSGDRGQKSVREQIGDINEKTCAFFEKLLRDPINGKAGMSYFRARGLTDETLARFRLGYSPESWTGLVTAAGRPPLDAITGDALFQAGLAKRRTDGSFYDAFRGWVMFPILDSTGRVIAFGGRILVEKRDEAGNVVEAKYLNSPETAVFNKSEALYGLNLAKQEINKTGTVIVVEGYMDVIACHQAGVTNVVATLGTALTPEHAKILRRFCHTVVLVFDSDDAGYRAADRAMETFVREPLDVKIASVPDGKDPCDFCMNHGGEKFRQVVAGATDALTFQWNRLQRQFHGTDSLSARQAAATAFVRFAAQAMAGREMDPIRRGLLVAKIAGLLGLPTNEVNGMLRRAGETPARAVEAGDGEPAAAPKNMGGVLIGPAAAEGWVLGALLTEPRRYEGVREDMTADLFVEFRPLAERIIEYLENATDLATCSLADFCANVAEGELAGEAIRLQTQAEAGGNVPEKLSDGLKRLRETRNLTQEKAEQAGNSATDATFQQQLADLRKKGEQGEVRRVFGRRTRDH